MPTGIEETLAVLVAAVVQAAEFGAFTAPPDGNRVSQPVTDAGEFGAEMCLPDAESYEGGAEQSIDPGIAGSDQPSAPITGDAPRLSPPSRHHEMEGSLITARPPAADVPKESTNATVSPADTTPPPAAVESPHAGEAESPDAALPDPPATATNTVTQDPNASPPQTPPAVTDDPPKTQEEITTFDIFLDTLAKLPEDLFESREEKRAPIAEIYQRQGYDEETANAMADEFLDASNIDLSPPMTRGFSRFLFKPKSGGGYRREKDDNRSKTTDPSVGNTGFKRPPSWPSPKKVKLGEHVDHYEGSPRMSQSSGEGGSKSVMPVPRETYERMVRDAFKNADTAFHRTRQPESKGSSIFHDKITLRGKSGRWLFEMVFNITTGTIETAYPVTK